MENPPLEDVFPIGKSGFPLLGLVYWIITHFEFWGILEESYYPASQRPHVNPTKVSPFPISMKSCTTALTLNQRKKSTRKNIAFLSPPIESMYGISTQFIPTLQIYHEKSATKSPDFLNVCYIYLQMFYHFFVYGKKR